jgi:phasin family protein
MATTDEAKSAGKSKRGKGKGERRKKAVPQQAVSQEATSKEVASQKAASKEQVAQEAANLERLPESPTPTQLQAPEPHQRQPDHAASPKVDQQPVADEPVLVASPEPQPAAAPSPAEPVSAAAPVAEPASAAPSPAEPAPVSLQTIANAYRDYTRKSIQDFGSFVEQLSSARSLDKAMSVQSEFVKRAYETSVAESQKICELHNRLAKQSLDPFKALTGKNPAPHSKR